MINPLIQKLDRRDPTLSAEEKGALDKAIVRVFDLEADVDIVREYERPAESSLVLEGWAARYVTLSNGRRQILALHLPGDFVDLHSFPLKRMDHSVATLTACKIAAVRHESLREISERFPHLTRLLWLSTLIDAAILRQWLLGSGRRSALEQMAHLLCELLTRLQVVGLTEDQRFRLPLTQAELGDVLGMSTVHVNRVIQELRGEGLITWRGDIVVVQDWERLSRIAEFDATYLNLEAEPR